MSGEPIGGAGAQLRRGLLALETAWDRVRLGVKRRLGRLGPAEILAHRGYSDGTYLYVSGRLLERQGLCRPHHGASRWQNLREAWKRFESDELPGVPIEARFGPVRQATVTDREGYFRFRLRAPEPDAGWQTVALATLGPIASGHDVVAGAAEVLVPRRDARFAVISDIDDTVLVTGATRPLGMVYRTLFENALSREPVEEIDRAYRLLAEAGRNPVFYLSSSPWNLYDLLGAFLEHHRFPRGPMFLQDWGLTPEQWCKAGHARHKKARCHELLARFPQLPFVLVGDAGERDADIYADLAGACPERIAAIYIRAVDGRPRGRFEAAAARAGRVGVPMLQIESAAQLEHDVRTRLGVG